jgi:hypothetical protein
MDARSRRAAWNVAKPWSSAAEPSPVWQLKQCLCSTGKTSAA